MERSKDIRVAALVVETTRNGRNFKIRVVCAVVLMIVVDLENRDDGCRYCSAPFFFKTVWKFASWVRAKFRFTRVREDRCSGQRDGEIARTV